MLKYLIPQKTPTIAKYNKERNIDKNPERCSSSLKRYFNLYENLTTDAMIFICENEYTIIPNSYVMYINYKRLINTRSIDRVKWLQHTLDLAC